MAHGQCLCGALQYEVGGPFSLMLHCHCSMCRKHHGTAFATFLAAPLDSFKWISGEDNLERFQSSEKGHRPFCRTCGSVGPTLALSMGIVICPAGNLDGDLGVKPEYHMFVGSKAVWHTIDDSLPQHESWPPDFGSEVVDRPPREVKEGCTGGSCLCGDVAYEYSGAPLRVWLCHCSRCRRARSAAHGANAFVKLEQFAWTRGQSQVKHFKVPEAKFYTIAFCTRCGSETPMISEARGMVIIPMGSLDSEPGMRPGAHVFTGSRAPWFDITGPTAQFVEAPPMPAPPPRAT